MGILISNRDSVNQIMMTHYRTPTKLAKNKKSMSQSTGNEPCAETEPLDLWEWDLLHCFYKAECLSVF